MYLRRTSSFLLSILVVLPNAYIKGMKIVLILMALFDSIVLALMAFVLLAEHAHIKDR